MGATSTMTTADGAAKLVKTGVPADRIDATGEDVHIVLSPAEAERFSVRLAVLEENGAVRKLVRAVWA